MKSILAQVSGCLIPIEDLAPCVRAYNAGVADFEGRRLMAYRQEPDDHFRSRIRIAEIIGTNARNDEPVEIPEAAPGMESLEDPRLFHHAGALWLAWTAAVYSGTEWTCRQCYGRLDAVEGGWRITEAIVPGYGRNGGASKEKNWQFFSVEDRLFAQYSPSHVIELEGDKVVAEWKEKAIPWRWGKPSGGTPPVPFSPGKLISFFHAFTFDPIYARRYNFAAMIFEDRPPFRRIAYSVAPLVYGSDADPLPAGKIWQPLCIFPCGAVRDGGDWLITAGVNDERIALLRIPESRLMLETFEVGNLPAQVLVELIEPIVKDGDIVVPPEKTTLPRATAIELMKRGKVILTPQTA